MSGKLASVSDDPSLLLDRPLALDAFVSTHQGGFVKYNEVLFSWAPQQRLALALRRAARRGAMIVCTNANHESVLKL